VLTVIATVRAKQGKEKALEQELVRLIPPTLEEEGCINYDLLRCLETPGKFVFYENWASAEELEQHLATDHVKAFLAAAGSLWDGPIQVERFEMVD
jgi:quinol monooxygenase YgiN